VRLTSCVYLILLPHLLQQHWTTFNDPIATYGQITSNAAESSHNVLKDEGRKLPPTALMLHCMQDDASKMNDRRLLAEKLMKQGVVYLPKAEKDFKTQKDLGGQYGVTQM
jgi:hypothetical protein